MKRFCDVIWDKIQSMLNTCQIIAEKRQHSAHWDQQSLMQTHVRFHSLRAVIV